MVCKMRWNVLMVIFLLIIIGIGAFYTGISLAPITTVTATFLTTLTSTVTPSNAIIKDTTPRVGIVIAMLDEARYIFEIFDLEKSFAAMGYNFSVGKIAGKPVVIVISGIGEEAAAGAVMAMSTLFNIKWAVNIGTAGAHSYDHDTGDVIVAARIVPYGNRRYLSYENWAYMRLGITLVNGTRFRFLYLNTSNELLDLAERASREISLPPTPANLTGRNQDYYPKIFLNGTIASANIWTANSTYILRIHQELSTDAEEMEAYGFGLACYRLGMPFIKIAVISNNELTGSPWSPESIMISMRNGAKLLMKMIELGG